MKTEPKISATERSEILASIDRLLGPTQTGLGRFEAHAPPLVPEATRAAMLPESPLSRDERDALKKLAKQFDDAVTRAGQFGHDKVRGAVADAGRAFADGKNPAPKTRAEISSQFEAQRAAAKSACRKIAAEAAALLEPIAARLEGKIQERVDAELLAEWQSFAALGVTFEPSLRTRTLYAVMEAARRARLDLAKADRGIYGVNPRQQAASLGIVL